MEDDRSSVGTAEILREPFAPSIVDDAAAASASATATDAKQEGDDGWKAAAAAPADQAGRGSAMPAKPSTPTSLLALEAELIARHAAPAAAGTADDDVGVRFMVDAEWLRQWSGYVHGQQGCLPPGPLANLALYDARTLRLRQGLVQDIDYRALTPPAYYILAILYGTADDDAGSGDATMPAEICRFGPNIYGAEVPASKLRQVSQDAKQRAHSEVNRLMARQRRRILGGGFGGGGADDTGSIVSSCSSFQIGGRKGGQAGGGGDEAAEGDEDEAEPPSCCARWFYPLCFALAPASFHRYARDHISGGSGQRRRRGGVGGIEVDDVASMISASFTLDLGEGEEDEDLLLWRSKPRRPGSLGLAGLGRGAGAGCCASGGGGAFGSTSTML